MGRFVFVGSPGEDLPTPWCLKSCKVYKKVLEKWQKFGLDKRLFQYVYGFVMIKQKYFWITGGLIHMMSYKCLVFCSVDQCRSLTICAVLRTQDFCLVFGCCQLELLWWSRCGLKLEKSIAFLHVSNITSFSTSRLFWVEAKRTCPFFSSKNAAASIQPKDWRSIFVWWISTSKPTIHVAKSWSACHVKPLVGDWHFPFFLECFGLFCDIWVISPIWLDVNCQSFPQISHDFRPGADFEAAKVRRAVKAAAQRVKAPQGVFQLYSSALKISFFSFFRVNY